MKHICNVFIRLLLLFVPSIMSAQIENPVHFRVSQKRVSPTEILLTFHGNIEKGWHVYSSDIPTGGPTAATLHINTKNGIEVISNLIPQGNIKKNFDQMFNMQVRYFEGTATFLQRLKILNKNYAATGFLEYGACNDQNCTPPSQIPFKIKGNDGPATVGTTPTENKQEQSSTILPHIDTSNIFAKDSVHLEQTKFSFLRSYWKPVTQELKAFGGTQRGNSLLMVFLLGLLGGLIAVITPCVWPIIPMTVSYFLKRSEHKKRGIRDALLYGLSIIVIYVSLGLLITLAYGPNGLNALSTSAVFNLICFAILIIFAASFLGGFDITLPSSWSNRTDKQAESKGGFIGIFLMALTLCIVSFSCTGPIIGFLLVDISTSAIYLAPILGMFGFAIALALPFTLFALFPSLIKKAPKSGGWMNTVKVTLGFVELAFALKFFSVADMAYGWHLLDRETFLALWIVLFTLLGIYLLGKLRFPADDNKMHTTIPGFFGGFTSLAFAIYMLPGLWGAPLRAISAFAPPMYTQDFNLNKENVTETIFHDYDTAIAKSKETGKPLLLDFTGYGCVNCRKMEAAVWTDSRVAKILKKDFILVSLYVDDKTPLDHPIDVIFNGNRHTLYTYADKWSFLQSYKFGANTQPFYVAVDAKGNPLNRSYSYNENVDKYIDFLQVALKNYKK